MGTRGKPAVAPEGWCSRRNDKARPPQAGRREARLQGGVGRINREAGGEGTSMRRATGAGFSPRLRITQKEGRTGSDRPLRLQGGADYFASGNS